MTYKDALERLASETGCTLDVHANGSIYLDAPEGKVFASSTTKTLTFGGTSVGAAKPDWRGAFQFFAAELKEGFWDDDE